MDRDKLQTLHNYLAKLSLKTKEFQVSDMTLRDDSFHPVAYTRTGTLTHNTHAGQMKLLLADEMSIMLGLLHICSKSKTTLRDLEAGSPKVAVVVAGAAPGIHFTDLVCTFGFVDFHLYDPAPHGWYPPLEHRPNVTLYTQKFTVDTAREWKDNKQYNHVIFLSDLRTGDGMEIDGAAVFSQSKFENAVSDDMENQRQMTKLIGACYSVLKFRLRYYNDDTPPDKKTLEYLDGTIYFEGYAPNHSTETRLHVTDLNSVKTYDIQVYQDQLFYHNQVTRKHQLFYHTHVPPNPTNEELTYDNAHARFVKHFLLQHLPSVSDYHVRDSDGSRFDHTRIRVLLDNFKLLLT